MISATIEELEPNLSDAAIHQTGSNFALSEKKLDFQQVVPTAIQKLELDNPNHETQFLVLTVHKSKFPQ